LKFKRGPCEWWASNHLTNREERGPRVVLSSSPLSLRKTIDLSTPQVHIQSKLWEDERVVLQREEEENCHLDEGEVLGSTHAAHQPVDAQAHPLDHELDESVVRGGTFLEFQPLRDVVDELFSQGSPRLQPLRQVEIRESAVFDRLEDSSYRLAQEAPLLFREGAPPRSRHDRYTHHYSFAADMPYSVRAGFITQYLVFA
jgi:hypothetical protein